MKGLKGRRSRRGSGAPILMTHPHASEGIRRAKGIGGLAGFALAALAGLLTGASPVLLGLWALGTGVCGYVVAWGLALYVWRQIVLAEIAERRDEAESEYKARLEEIQAGAEADERAVAAAPAG